MWQTARYKSQGRGRLAAKECSALITSGHTFKPFKPLRGGDIKGQSAAPDRGPRGWNLFCRSSGKMGANNKWLPTRYRRRQQQVEDSYV